MGSDNRGSRPGFSFWEDRSAKPTSSRSGASISAGRTSTAVRQPVTDRPSLAFPFAFPPRLAPAIARGFSENDPVVCAPRLRTPVFLRSAIVGGGAFVGFLSDLHGPGYFKPHRSEQEKKKGRLSGPFASDSKRPRASLRQTVIRRRVAMRYTQRTRIAPSVAPMKPAGSPGPYR